MKAWIKNLFLVPMLTVCLGLVLAGSVKGGGNYNGFWWNQIGNAVEITNYTGSGGAVIIPSTINNLPVITIGTRAFDSGLTLTSVTIPDSVTTIGVDAFSYCYNLTNVTIGKGVVSILDYAFFACGYYGGGFTSITIPGSVTDINGEAFGYNRGLTNVCFEGNAPSFAPGGDGPVFDGDPVSVIRYIAGTTGWGSGYQGTPTISCAQCGSVVTITGQVSCTCGGSPITNASVQFGGLTATSDSSGNYSISNVPPGTYTAIVSASSYYTLTNSVIIPTSPSVITNNFALTPLGTLDYFGIGVNWLNAPCLGNPPQSCVKVRGDLAAANLLEALDDDLPSLNSSGTVILDASASGTGNFNAVATGFNQFRNSVCPGDTVIFYVDSHGGNFAGEGGYIAGSAVALNNDGTLSDQLLVSNLAPLLNTLPVNTRIIIIIDACNSGGLSPIINAVSSHAVSLLSACYGGSSFLPPDMYVTYVANDGISVFTTALIDEIDADVHSLSTIASDIQLDVNKSYANLLGQSLYLQDTGSATFAGLFPQFAEGSGFSGDLLGPTQSGLPPLPTISSATMSNGYFRLSLARVPTNGNIAVEMSTDLVTWVQIAFNPAAGTNLLYSIPMTNQPSGFVRAKVTP